VAGKLLTFLYVEAPAWIDVTYKSGKEMNYRFAPSLAKSRFTLSPNFSERLACYFQSCSDTQGAEVVKIRITALGDSLFFHPNIKLKLTDYHLIWNKQGD
jgi:hypothetical protein